MPGTDIVRFVDIGGLPQDAEKLVATLEQVGGSIERLLADCSSDQHEYLLSLAEQLIAESKDKRLQHRWNQSIRRNSIARLRLLQNRSLKRLEELGTPSGEDKQSNWIGMAKEASAHKMILASLLAGDVHTAKQKTIEPEEIDEEDEADLAEVMDDA